MEDFSKNIDAIRREDWANRVREAITNDRSKEVEHKKYINQLIEESARKRREHIAG